MATSIPAERITGIILIVLVPIFVASAYLGLQFDTGADDFRAEVQDLADNQEIVIAQSYVSFLLAAILIAAAAATYVTLRSREPVLALFGSLGFFAAAVVFLAAGGTAIALAELADDFESASGDVAEGILPTIRAVAFINQGFIIAGFGLFSLGALGLGVLILRSVALPPWLGWPAVVGGVLGFAGIPIFLPAMLGWLLCLLWLLFAGGLLIWRGTPAADVTA